MALLSPHLDNDSDLQINGGEIAFRAVNQFYAQEAERKAEKKEENDHIQVIIAKSESHLRQLKG